MRQRRRFCEIRLRRRANRLKPAAYVDLRVGFAAEVPSASRARGIYIPLEHRELRIATLNDNPVIGVVGDSSTDFTSEFLKSRHAIALFSYGSTRLRIMERTASLLIELFIVPPSFSTPVFRHRTS